MRSRLTIIVPSLALLAACGGDGPTNVTAFNGALSFTYSGANSGTFDASGSVPTGFATPGTSAWAAGQASTGTEMFVVAITPRSSTTHDLVGLFIQRNTVGSATIASSCSSTCNDMGFTIGSANNGSSFTTTCSLDAGTIAITEKSSARMKGTFSGTGTCLTQAGASGAFTVTNGTFDVAIVPDVP